MEFRDKFIAFVDILGFRDFVESAERGTGMSLAQLYDAAKLLGTQDDIDALEEYGPTICPMSARKSQNLDFQITQISDCVIVSAEVSPAGAINLIYHCWVAVFKLLKQGFLCRGHIRRGNIYHVGNQVIGTGYQQAYERERSVAVFKRDADERGTPFVEIDLSVHDYINSQGDDCILEMFSRFVKDDGEVCALFPFKRLSHSFGIGGFGRAFEPEEEKKHNNTMRTIILDLKNKLQTHVDPLNGNAVRKLAHYEAALDAQLGQEMGSGLDLSVMTCYRCSHGPSAQH